MEQHGILGNAVGADGRTRIYTRTVVLWAVGLTIDTELLWKNVEVVEQPVQLIPLTDRISLERPPPSKRPRNATTTNGATKPVVLMIVLSTDAVTYHT